METYTAMRHFADSWGLVFMFAVFAGVVVWALRPGSRRIHEDAAMAPFRHDEPGQQMNRKGSGHV